MSEDSDDLQQSDFAKWDKKAFQVFTVLNCAGVSVGKIYHCSRLSCYGKGGT